ncbi:uridine phosphorylase [Escherichia coli]|uniref:Uridine phosphorylase n=1 Tax=Escherichia coli TaxID=562 RepID=A0A377DZS7_ECOLX|nr:uridine phosphorylase [Escherichia coli]
MSKSDVFHLGLTKNDLQGATLAIVPGDPDRVEKIAALMDKPVKLASHREFTTWRAELDGKPVIVCSTGIGGPSTSIAVEELHSWAFAPSCVSVQRALFSRILMWVMSWLPRRLSVWMARACTSHRWNSPLSLISNVRLRWLKLRNPLARQLTLA